jgi:shikimate kinase
MIYFITGFTGVGKTTIGRELAVLTNLPFIDLDESIEKKINQSITSYFEKNGEDAFRDIERQTLLESIKLHSEAIIVLGGGTLSYRLNHIPVLQSGTLLFLELPWDELYARIKKLKNRPTLQGKTEAQMKAIFVQRLPFYELSQLKMPINSGFSTRKLANILKLSTNR